MGSTKFVKGFTIGAVLLLLLVFCITGCTHPVAEGQKVGTVIKVAKEGVINGTYEMEVIRGGMSNGSVGFSTTPLHATINDPELLKKAQDALEGQYEVRVWYVTYFFTPHS